MKINENFILREVADRFVVVAVGDAMKNFDGVITLNGTGAFLWRLLQKGAEEEELVSAMLAEYDVDEAKAREDVHAFIGKLTAAKILK